MTDYYTVVRYRRYILVGACFAELSRASAATGPRSRIGGGRRAVPREQKGFWFCNHAVGAPPESNRPDNEPCHTSRLQLASADRGPSRLHMYIESWAQELVPDRSCLKTSQKATITASTAYRDSPDPVLSTGVPRRQPRESLQPHLVTCSTALPTGICHGRSSRRPAASRATHSGIHR